MKNAVWGLKARVLLLIIAPSLLVLMMLVMVIQRDIQKLQIDFENNGHMMANQVAVASEYGAITENIDTLRNAVRSVIKLKDVDGVAILSPEQKTYVVQGQIQLIAKTPNEFYKPYICHSSPMLSVFCAPIIYTPYEVSDFEDGLSDDSEQVFIGSVQISVSSQELIEDRNRSILYAIFVIILSLFSILLITRRIDGNVVAPILELKEMVNGIGRGKMDQRATKSSSGEIALLQDGVNKMAEELNSYHSEMESKVLNATIELRSALAVIGKKNEELETAWNKAEDASRSKSLFLAAMSHEIRTPLSGMMGMLSLVERSELSPLQKDQIHNIKQASMSLKALIDDVLDFSRIEAGKLNILNSTFSITKLINEIVDMLAPSAYIKGLDFVVDIDRAVPDRVIGDNLRVKQVLINILSNAIKFTETGWVIFRVCLSNPQPSNNRVSVCFDISDSGIGIPSERQINVFERFSQVEQGHERQYEGSGLGATTAKQLVELMGGTITLKSEEGIGSQFTINLAWEQVEDDRHEDNFLPFQDEKILIVEAHRRSGEVVSRYLKELGARVNLICHFDELDGDLDESNFDRIIVSDEFDSDTKLAETMKNISASKGSNNMQFGIMSTLSDKNSKQLSSDKYDFRLIKPITPTRVIHMLSHTVDRVSPYKQTSGNSMLSLLVAEDDEINAKVITFLLEKRGHQVTRVTNGNDAISELQNGLFNAVFMDVRMPGMSGIDATKQWREQEQNNNSYIPIVALTANDSEQDICMQVGMDGFVLKPISSETLDRLDVLIPGI